jgi:putative ABC transport system substrate-binding protein
MKRRGFLISLTGAIIGARAALAQQMGDKPRRIGALMPFLEQDADGRARFAAFLEQMQQLGWTEGRNLRIDVRWAGPDPDRIRIAANELLELQPDLIFTDGSVPVVELARETRTLPIVFAAVADPVGIGVAASLAHPGGNLSGFANSDFSIGGKWLQIIKEIAPNIARVGVLLNSTTAHYAARYLQSIEEASLSLALSISTLSVGDPAELEHAMGEDSMSLVEQLGVTLRDFAPLTGGMMIRSGPDDPGIWVSDRLSGALEAYARANHSPTGGVLRLLREEIHGQH